MSTAAAGNITTAEPSAFYKQETGARHPPTKHTHLHVFGLGGRGNPFSVFVLVLVTCKKNTIRFNQAVSNPAI